MEEKVKKSKDKKIYKDKKNIAIIVLSIFLLISLSANGSTENINNQVSNEVIIAESQEISELENVINELKNGKAEVEKNLEELQNDNEKLKEDLNNLQTEKEQNESKISELEAQLQDLKNNNDSLNQENQNLKTQISENAKVSSASIVSTQSSSYAVSSSSDSTSSATVYVTKTGSKYHRAGCRYLKSKISKSKSDAIAQGYSACSVCNP